MTSRVSKLFFSIIFILCFTSCDNEDPDTPPFSFSCLIHILDKNGESLLDPNEQLLKDIEAYIVEPVNEGISVYGINYLRSVNCLQINISDSYTLIENKGTYEQEYIVKVKYPDEIRTGTDIIRIKYQFKDYRPTIKEAYYNTIKPQEMDASTIVFQIKEE